MYRLLVLAHRYLGIALCLLMAAWTISGLVMLYVSFPSYGADERIQGLPALDLADCCDLRQARESLGNSTVDSFEISMQRGRPVLNLARGRITQVLDLRSGTLNGAVEASRAGEIVNEYIHTHNTGGAPRYLSSVDHDQWTVSEGYARVAPMHRIALDDAAGTELYVSAVTGQIAQRTTARQRRWNYVGAITHWLYFTPLRERPGLWGTLVIWLALAGTVLSATGLTVGIVALRAARTRRTVSPYVGLKSWHHISGLLFGVLTLAWVFSGFVSMNPWGLLESRYGSDDSRRIYGPPLTVDQILDVVSLLSRQRLPAGSGDAIRIYSAPLGGHPFIIVASRSGLLRLDGTSLQRAPLTINDISQAAARLQRSDVPPAVDLLMSGDDYYYGDRDNDYRPVYRAILNDDERSRCYFDAVSGQLLIKFDRAARGYRWAFNAIHRWDFSRAMRSHPLRDLVMITLLVGIGVGSLTGVYLGIRKLLCRPS